jgi:predicted dehydrogenase
VTRPRIGLVGFGRWGRNILRDLLALGCPVTVVERGDRAEALRAGATDAVASVDQLTEVDGVVVATPTSTHAEVVDRLLSRVDGPVFVEKPMTDDPASARRLAEVAPHRLFVMDKWRYHPGVEALRDLAKDGGVGRVRGIRTVRHQWGVQHRDVDGIWILVPHEIAIATEILGSLLPPRAAFGYSVGQDATLSAVFGSDPWASLEVSTVSNGYRREIAVLGERAVGILPDPYADHLEVRTLATDEVRRIAISTELPLLRELRAFIEHLEGGPTPRSSAGEGAASVALIAELRRMAGVDGG